jgi:hypothetical protein
VPFPSPLFLPPLLSPLLPPLLSYWDTFGKSGSISDDNRVRTTCAHFLSSDSHQLGVLVVQDDEDDGGALLDEGEWAVLQRSSTVPFRVQVGDFLDLRTSVSFGLFF